MLKYKLGSYKVPLYQVIITSQLEIDLWVELLRSQDLIDMMSLNLTTKLTEVLNRDS